MRSFPGTRLWLAAITLLAAGCAERPPAADESPTAETESTSTPAPDAPESIVTPTADATAPTSGAGEPVTADNLTAADISVGLERIAGGFVHPLVFTHAGDGSGRMFLADQIGVIYVITADGQVDMARPFLDLRDRMVALTPDYDERGLLGLAFHPDYARNGRLFVFYNAPLRSGAPADWNSTVHVSEFRVSADDPNRADPASERIVVQVDKPQMNHNGGQIAFGPDGHLYIPLGDGGGPNDMLMGHMEDWYAANSGGNGQDTEHNLLGSILRIDVDQGEPYGIPADNPVPPGGSGPTEQWAWGFRNPYRISFDSGGEHWLYVGDAGQVRWEEVSVVQRGGNYGWNVKEGTHCFNAEDNNEELHDCPEADLLGNPLLNPVLEFKNGNRPDGVGIVVIGGNVYRGHAIPVLVGQYVFASWTTSWNVTRGQLFVAMPGLLDGSLWAMAALPAPDDPMGRLDAAVLSFGEGPDGELYVLTSQAIGPELNTGEVWKIIPGP